MNGRIRLGALAPLMVSSLALGSVPFTAGSAQAVVPTATCSVTKRTSDMANIAGQGFTPGSTVRVLIGGISSGSFTIGATGTIAVGITGKVGVVSLQEEGGAKVICGTIQQAEQKESQDQYKKGFLDGFNAAKATCKAQAPQGVTAVDPNYEKGFNAGAAAAIAKYC
ncbi:hypothetical protein [Streptomyces chiangmaiensis]|uniref:Secreted protein n=1 Tax=Streptomyces chiangmaiensis TaxID=766497 RepID=A0ABU7FDJ3_9ACTN|nr:hypothetical protein [Streptomyces chiangmaiensis]MED7822164.1 hypothetical protein [Streptomyces chiangmaiensis]